MCGVVELVGPPAQGLSTKASIEIPADRGLIVDLTKDANSIRERVDCSVIGFVVLIDDV